MRYYLWLGLSGIVVIGGHRHYCTWSSPKVVRIKQREIEERKPLYTFENLLNVSDKAE